MTHVLAVFGLLLIAAVMIVGFVLSYWICMAGISALYIEQKGLGIAVICSSAGSMLTAMAIACGIFWLMTTYLPL